MKKVFSFLAVLAVTVFMASSAWATDFSSTTKSAVVEFGSAGDIVFDVKVFTWVSGTDYDTGYTGAGLDTALSFSTSTITLGSSVPQWSPCNQIIKIHSNLSTQAAGHKVSMYTDNSKATSAYKATAPRGSGDAARYNGLVRIGNSGMDNDFAPLKILSRKVSEANDLYPTAQPPQAKFEHGYDGARTVVDLHDANYSTLAENGSHMGKTGKNGGIWVGDGNGEGGYSNWYSGSEDAVLFLGAEFTGVVANDVYGTDTITFIYEVE